jgi:hypothetical protein
VDKQIDEEPTARPQSQHLADTPIIEILPPASDKKTPALTSASPKNQTRITRSTITSRPLTPSAMAPTITQTPPIAATITHDSPITAATDPTPTIITCASSQKRKRPFKGKPQRSIDQIGSTSNRNPLATAIENSIGVQIPGFTLCPEPQETIFSFQNKCTQFIAESSVLPDDSTHPMSIDDIHIIVDPNIPEYPPCVLEEEHPVPPPAMKKKTTTFVSTLPRRKTRSTKSVEAAIGRQDMEQAVPILHPLFPMVDAETVPQESTVHIETDPQELVLTDTTVTQEPTAPQNIVPLEAVILEPTVHVETAPQEPVLIATTVTQEPAPQHAEDVPLAQIEQKIKNTKNSRIAALITENNNLKAELKTLKQEVAAARQKNPEGITLDILSLTKAVMGREKELMCFECGNIYYEVGYEVVKVPVATEPTNVSIKTEHGLPATQKSVKQRRSQHHNSAPGIPEACKQEPLFPSGVVTRATQTDHVLRNKETQIDC